MAKLIIIATTIVLTILITSALTMLVIFKAMK